MMTTVKKAVAMATDKALASDLNNQANWSLIFDHGADNLAARSKTQTTIITQTNKGSCKADSSQPKVLYVTSSNAMETQGSFLKVSICADSWSCRLSL